MRYLRITDYEKLKEILESPDMYDEYRRFVPSEVYKAKVMEYKHDGGVEIRGWSGRWWVYVRVWYGKGYEYDIALWKLGQRILRRLAKEGVLEVIDEKEGRKEPVSV